MSVDTLVKSVLYKRCTWLQPHRIPSIKQYQHLWSSGYDSRLGLSKDIKCERSQVRVLASALSFAFVASKLVGGVVRGVWGQLCAIRLMPVHPDSRDLPFCQAVNAENQQAATKVRSLVPGRSGV